MTKPKPNIMLTDDSIDMSRAPAAQGAVMSKKVCLVVGKIPKWKIRHVLRFKRATNMIVVRAPTARSAKKVLRTHGCKPKRVRMLLIADREIDDWPNAHLKLKRAYWHHVWPDGRVSN